MLAARGNDVDPKRLAGTHVFDQKVDGVRALLYWDGTHLSLVGRDGTDYTAKFPEIRMSGKPLILDGELVADDERFATVARRTKLGASNTGQAAVDTPCSFVAFDVLQLSQNPIMQLPYIERRDVLERLEPRLNRVSGGRIRITKVSDDPGIVHIARAAGLEGVIAKKIDSPYVPGSRGTRWIKIKNTHRITAIATGYTPGDGRLVGALEIALFDAATIVSIGRVGAGFSAAEMRFLKQELDAMRPVLVEIEMLNVGQNKQMRSGVYVGLCSDKTLADASVAQLKEIPNY